VVYRATDTRLERTVAIKALPDHVAADPERLARFEREAKTLAALNHQNVAHIYGVEEKNGARYLVLEYVEGQTIAELLDHGPLSTNEAIELAIQVAKGLEAAHDAGIVHRDLKPANVRVTPENVAKVLDFGLARADEGATGASHIIPPSSHVPTASIQSPQPAPTAAGAVMGTAPYMSPEQARGRKVDKRTDIWSFGVLLYEMLSGASPFAGETATDSIGAILHKDIDLNLLPKDLPLQAQRVLKRCLERDRNLRLHDIADARLDLEEALHAPIQGIQSADQKKTPWIANAGWLAAALAAAAFFTLRPSTESPAQPLRVSVAAPNSDQLFDVRVSPLGDTALLYAASLPPRVDDGQYFLRRLDTGAIEPVPNSQAADLARFSPDGKWLGFAAPISPRSSTYRFMKLELESGLPPIEVAILPDSFRAQNHVFCWTSSQEVAFIDGSHARIRLLNVESGTISEPIDLDQGDYTGLPDALTGAIDPTRLLARAFLYNDQGFRQDIVVLDLTSKSLTPIVENASAAKIGPDGSLLFARGDVLFGATFDPRTLDVGPPAQLIAGLRTGSTWQHARFSITNDGAIAFLPGGVQGANRRIAFLDDQGGVEYWPGEGRAYENSMTLSPDGSKLLTTVTAPTGLYEIWGSDIDPPRLRRLRASPTLDYSSPVFGPDNDTFVCQVSNNETSWLEVSTFDSISEPRVIFECPTDSRRINPTSIHPDGDRVIATLIGESGAILTEIPLDGSAPERQLLSGAADYASGYFSPDGSMLAFISNETGRPEAYVRAINDDGSLGPAAAVTQRGAVAVRWRGPLAPDSPQRLIVYNNAAMDAYDITPGRRPRVGQAERLNYDLSTRRNGSGHIDANGVYSSIMLGDDELPATRADLIFNSYPQIQRLIQGK